MPGISALSARYLCHKWNYISHNGTMHNKGITYQSRFASDKWCRMCTYEYFDAKSIGIRDLELIIGYLNFTTQPALETALVRRFMAVVCSCGEEKTRISSWSICCLKMILALSNNICQLKPSVCSPLDRQKQCNV
jgi:hypothetical protein